MSIEIDSTRFEKYRVGATQGYYDKIARVFIAEKTLKILFDEVKPSYKPIDTNDIVNSQRRVLNNLESDSLDNDTYAQIFLMHLSHSYLLKNSNKNDVFVILYIDLVGSTALAATISIEMVAKLVRTFCQEMSIIISRFGGYVLKYAGDAVIAFFPPNPDLINTCANTIECSYSMMYIIERSINDMLFQKNLPKIKARISIDAGYNQIIVLGSEPDLLGHVISRAAKIMSKAKPNQIVIGEEVYKNLDDMHKRKFQSEGSYKLHESGEEYPLYTSIYDQ
ncbi:MAG: adenylate/guanylate cyclase domain-containing protein [Candidatus Nitrosocaldaceae archaeon]